MSNHYESRRLLSPAVTNVIGCLPLIDFAELPGGGRRIIDRHGSSYVIPIGNEQFVAVDGGMDRQAKRLEWFINKQGLALKNCAALFITHAHIDHEGLLSKLADNKSTKVFINESENEVLQGRAQVEGLISKLIEKAPGLLSAAIPGIETEILSDGEIVKFSHLEVRAMTLPGHTTGNTGYMFSSESDGSDVLYSGDALDFTIKNDVRIAPSILSDDSALGWQTVINLPERLRSIGKSQAEIVPSHSGNSSADNLLGTVAKRLILESEIRAL